MIACVTYFACKANFLHWNNKDLNWIRILAGVQAKAPVYSTQIGCWKIVSLEKWRSEGWKPLNWRPRSRQTNNLISGIWCVRPEGPVWGFRSVQVRFRSHQCAQREKICPAEVKTETVSVPNWWWSAEQSAVTYNKTCQIQLPQLHRNRGTLCFTWLLVIDLSPHTHTHTHTPHTQARTLRSWMLLPSKEWESKQPAAVKRTV